MIDDEILNIDCSCFTYFSRWFFCLEVSLGQLSWKRSKELYSFQLAISIFLGLHKAYVFSLLGVGVRQTGIKFFCKWNVWWVFVVISACFNHWEDRMDQKDEDEKQESIDYQENFHYSHMEAVKRTLDEIVSAGSPAPSIFSIALPFVVWHWRLETLFGWLWARTDVHKPEGLNLQD